MFGGSPRYPPSWMTDPIGTEVAAEHIERLRWVYAAFVAGVAALVFVAAVLAISGVGGDVPAWLGLAVVAVVAVIGWFVIRYFRLRPHEDPGVRAYAPTVLLRAGVAVTPAAVGFLLFLATGNWAVQLVGALLTLPGLAWSAPSAADYARHRRLAIDVEPPPPDEVWGNTPPGYTPPWEDEHGGHGHGLDHHH